MKKLLFAIVLIVATAVSSFAQKTTELAVIAYSPPNRSIKISINGKEFKNITVPKEQIKDNSDANAGLIEVNKFLNDGWELFNTNTDVLPNSDSRFYTFYLIRKKD